MMKMNRNQIERRMDSQMHSRPQGRRTRRRQRMLRLGRAFSLIEVLIAILILALGLLGLGAVIPVVVREQRVAAETTRAVIAANNAAAYLQARPDLNRLVGDTGGSRGAGGSPGGGTLPNLGFGFWLENQSWSSSPVYGWDSVEATYTGYDSNSGLWRLPRTGARGVAIPVRDRLWPDPSSGAEPQLIWDFAARRVPSALQSWDQDANARTIEVAVFVRRIDPAIRVAPGRSRTEVLLLPATDPAFRRAVAVVDRQSGRPSGDGTGLYAEPRSLLARVQTSSRPDVVVLNEESGAGGVEYAGVPGQRLVDRFGNIYRVTRRISEGPITVQIDPPLPSSLPASIVSGGSDLQMIFTPQVPAAVKVFRITIPERPVRSPNGAGAGMSPWFGQVGQP